MPTALPSTKKTRLEDPLVHEWWDVLYTNSPATGDNYLRQLYRFCLVAGTTPAALRNMSAMALQRTVNKWIALVARTPSERTKKPIEASSRSTQWKAAKSYLEHVGRKSVLAKVTKVRIAGSRTSTRRREEIVPTQEEVGRMLAAAGPRARMVLAISKDSGVRPGALGSYTGDEGLRIRDVEGLTVVGDKIVVPEWPAMLTVYDRFPGDEESYFTWLGNEALEAIRAYLTQRLKGGEELGPDSPLLDNRGAKHLFVPTKKIWNITSKPLRRSGFVGRPYLTRSYFVQQLERAQQKWKFPSEWKIAWEGHATDERGRLRMQIPYGTGKGRHNEAYLKDHRDAYRHAYEFLATVPAREDSEAEDRLVRRILERLGFSGEQLDRLLLADPDELRRQVAERLRPPARAPGRRSEPLEEARRLAATGEWEPVHVADGQVILERVHLPLPPE